MQLIGKLVFHEGPMAGAVRAKEARQIQDWVQEQAAAGADRLELDMGPARRGLSKKLHWLVTVVQGAVDRPLAIRTADLEALRDVLHQAKGKALVDAAAPAVTDWRAFLAVAQQHGAQIALSASLRGLPTPIEERMVLSTEEMIPAALEAGVAINDLYIDPFVAAVSCDQPQAPVAVEAQRLLKVAADVVPNTLAHLEDISDGVESVEARQVLNVVYLVMLMGVGLDAVVADLSDPELQDAIRIVRRRDGNTQAARFLLRVHDSAGAGAEIDPAVVDLKDPELARLYKTWQILQNQVIYADGFLEA
jgi:cobalamin-dependent methionine synthase I